MHLDQPCPWPGCRRVRRSSPLLSIACRWGRGTSSSCGIPRRSHTACYRCRMNGRRRMLIVLLAIGMTNARSAALRGAEMTAQELAQALQRKIDGARDFSTEFVHAYQGGVLKK